MTSRRRRHRDRPQPPAHSGGPGSSPKADFQPPAKPRASSPAVLMLVAAHTDPTIAAARTTPASATRATRSSRFAPIRAGWPRPTAFVAFAIAPFPARGGIVTSPKQPPSGNRRLGRSDRQLQRLLAPQCSHADPRLRVGESRLGRSRRRRGSSQSQAVATSWPAAPLPRLAEQAPAPIVGALSQLVPSSSDGGIGAGGSSANASDSAGALASRRGSGHQQAHRRLPQSRQSRADVAPSLRKDRRPPSTRLGRPSRDARSSRKASALAQPWAASDACRLRVDPTAARREDCLRRALRASRRPIEADRLSAFTRRFPAA